MEPMHVTMHGPQYPLTAHAEPYAYHADSVLRAYAATLHAWSHTRYGSQAWEYWYGSAVSLAWAYSLLAAPYPAVDVLDRVCSAIAQRALRTYPAPAPAPTPHQRQHPNPASPLGG